MGNKWVHQDDGKTINNSTLQLPKTIAQLGNTDDPLVAVHIEVHI